MKLIETNNIIELNDLKIKSLRNSLLQELKLNSTCSSDRVKDLIIILDSVYSNNLDLKTRVDITRSVTLVSEVHLTKYINNIILLTEKIKFYNDLITDVVNYFNSESVYIDSQLKYILNSITDSVARLTEDLVELKRTIFTVELSLELIEMSSMDESDTTKSE